MKTDHLREPFELVLREFMDVCPRGPHMHSFFELIYIVDGTGTQNINDLQVDYKKGDLFLVAPQDTHLFKIATTSRFFFIRFNGNFLKESKKDAQLLTRLELILDNARHSAGCLLKNEPDKQAAGALIDILIREHVNYGLYHSDLMLYLVHTLLVIVARNVAQTFPEQVDETSDKRVLDILSYIQTNIYYPDKLRVDAIAEHFGLAENYLGPYFKKHTGESLQQYILQYKLKLIENRLLHSNMRISEIADAFGFTDKSHLNRIFKKYRMVSPSIFRSRSTLSH